MKTIFPASQLLKENWKSGLTVAFISVPLSIALSIASGAGPIPGLVTGIWATLIASLFGSSNYNIIGAAGALSTRGRVPCAFSRLLLEATGGRC